MASVGFAAKRVLLPLAVVFMSFAPMASAAPLDEAQMAEYPAEKFKHCDRRLFPRHGQWRLVVVRGSPGT